MGNEETKLETLKALEKGKTKRVLIDALKNLGIISAVFVFAHFNGAGYLWLLLLLVLV